MFGQNKFGGMLEKVPYYKFALVHCARRVHTPTMARATQFVEEHAPYRYDRLWGFRHFMKDFFHIINRYKELSRDADVDELLKKASSKKGRNFYSYYRMKNNDYG